MSGSRRMTLAEQAAVVATTFGGDWDLAEAFGRHCRAFTAGHPYAQQAAEPDCSSMASDYRHDGSVRSYACLSNYDGLVAVYRQRSDGRFEPMKRWPAWIVALDRDPKWRAHCRSLQKKDKRRRHQCRVQFEQLILSAPAQRKITISAANDAIAISAVA